MPTSKSDESWGRVNPLVVATRTASWRNLAVYFKVSGICSKAAWDKMRLNCQQLWKVQKDACSDVLEK
jgi:hypothetical protein